MTIRLNKLEIELIRVWAEDFAGYYEQYNNEVLSQRCEKILKKLAGKKPKHLTNKKGMV